MYDQPDVPSFTEIASFFGICVWLIPFALFVSLSASDNVLPTIGSEQPSHEDGGKNKRQGMVKVIVDYVLSAIGEVSRLAGWKKPEERFWVDMQLCIDNDLSFSVHLPVLND